jgi:hypothetical protein
MSISMPRISPSEDSFQDRPRLERQKLTPFDHDVLASLLKQRLDPARPVFDQVKDERAIGNPACRLAAYSPLKQRVRMNTRGPSIDNGFRLASGINERLCGIRH